MGVWNKSRTFSFDEQCDAILVWAKAKYSPRFDDPRKKSELLRFIMKEWISLTRVLLAMPEIMEAVVRASQQTNFPKVSLIEFPLQSAAGEDGLESLGRGASGPFVKFSRLRAASGRVLGTVALGTFLSRERTHVSGRVA